MNTKTNDFLPILLGSDMNVYGVARAFHEAYGVTSVAVAKSTLTATKDSQIVKVETIENFDDLEDLDLFVQNLEKVALRYPNQKLLLMACGDTYVEPLIKCKEQLSKYFVVPYIDETLMNKLISKEEFYSRCEEFGFEYPKTKILTNENYKEFSLDFMFPVIIKPSNSVEYWKCSFPGKKKAFKAHDESEFRNILNAIYQSTYQDHLIIQEFIPGDDSFMRVLNCYVGQDHQVKLMSLGHVLLEEHTPQGIGSHAAIINDYDEELLERVKKFLEAIEYQGIANFDIKYDSRDGKYKFFEINLRQGRSSYYVTASGYNLPKYVAEDFIYNHELGFTIAKEKHLWTIVPKYVLFKYISDENIKKEIRELYRQGKVTNSLFYKKDLNMKRFTRLYLHTMNHIRKYKKYFGNKGLS